MRKGYSKQRRLDTESIDQVQLNLECRDEIIPILKTVQHLYAKPDLCEQILKLVAQDVNGDSRSDCGREGMDYWQIVVLASVRLGCNLDYDRLQDLAENHRRLRGIMGVGEWDEKTSFDWRRIRDNVCLLRPATIDSISQIIVAEGHAIVPDAIETVRADSFVMETCIHYPTESTLIRDGVRKIISICLPLTVPNSDKLFSMFEPHTQLYKRGKAGEPVQFGRQVLVYEDAVGFIVHHSLMPREQGDKDVVIEQTMILQKRFNNRIRRLSFDRGFHSPDNQTELSDIVPSLCLPKPGAKQSVKQLAEANEDFLAAQQNHSGVESAIGALQSGNGQKQCRDRSELGFERYISLGILGRNLHVLGRLLIAREQPRCEAARSRRAA